MDKYRNYGNATNQAYIFESRGRNYHTNHSFLDFLIPYAQVEVDYIIAG